MDHGTPRRRRPLAIRARHHQPRSVTYNLGNSRQPKSVSNHNSTRRCLMKPAYRHVLPLVLVLLLAAHSIFAQATTGALSGKVTSEDKALPGVTVTIASPS